MNMQNDGGAIALWALVVWAAHFTLSYGLALVLPDARILDPMIIMVTLAALALLALLFRRAATAAKRKRIAQQSLLIAAIAIAWQSLVALF
jgi:hypothetical protein